MINIKNIEQLLSQVQIISNNYDRVIEANGDNFNIFSVLKIETDEVRTHSRFLAEMLNPLGVHGLKDQFLKLFIKTIGMDLNLKTNNCDVYVEYYQGIINKEYTQGGSIDIIIKEKGSSENVVMIENKIYAGEQRNQLLRYYNAFPKGKLIFLTLFGDDSSEESTEQIDYLPISYQNDIINWLEKCKMIAVDKPTLRETIKQYINLVKKLTNKNINTEMNEELTGLFTKNEENFDSFIAIRDLKDSIKNQIVREKVLPTLTELKNEFQEMDSDVVFDFNEDHILNSSKNYLDLLKFQNKSLIDKDLIIVFQFQKKNHNHLIGGVVSVKENSLQNINIHKILENEFNGIPTGTNQNWLSYFEYWYFMNWSSNLYDLKNLIFGNFKDDLRHKIKMMLKAVNNSKDFKNQ